MKNHPFRYQKWFIFLLLLFTTIFNISILYGQNKFYANVGIGAGLSYGGFGGKLILAPVQPIGLFGSLGYNLDALGYNVGIQVHIPSERKINVFATGMYGYNTVLIVDASITKTKTTYYGFSAGAGINYNFNKKSFLEAEILIPFRPSSYHDAISDLNLLGYEIKDPLPVAFGIGYHFKFLSVEK